MLIPEPDAKQFIELYKELLIFVVGKNEHLKNKVYNGVMEILYAGKAELHKNISIFDDFIDNMELNEEETHIIRNIQYYSFTTVFIVIKELKRAGYVSFVNDANEAFVFEVNALTSPFSEQLTFTGFPAFAKLTLIPYKNYIIHDGLIELKEVIIGYNMKRNFEEDYKEAKSHKSIISKPESYIHQFKKFTKK